MVSCLVPPLPPCSIVASLNDGVTALQEGAPVAGSVGASAYVYYTFTTIVSDTYTFTATPVSGDPDMYISADLYKNRSVVRPTLHDHMWFSNGQGTESIELKPTDQLVQLCGLPCTYYVGMSGFIRAAAYQLVVARPNSNMYTVLTKGVPQQGHIDAKQFAYYRFHADSVGDIQFLVTPLSGSVLVREWGVRYSCCMACQAGGGVCSCRRVDTLDVCVLGVCV